MKLKMSRVTNILFPLILDALTHKPMLCDTQSNLLRELHRRLRQQGIKVQNLKKELENTVDVGMGLGILTVQDEEVRMPFLLKATNDVRKMYDDKTSADGIKTKASEPSVLAQKTSPSWMPKNTRRTSYRTRCGAGRRRSRRSKVSRKTRRIAGRKRRSH